MDPRRVVFVLGLAIAIAVAHSTIACDSSERKVEADMTVFANGPDDIDTSTGVGFVHAYQAALCALNKRCHAAMFPDGPECPDLVPSPSDEQARRMQLDSQAAAVCLSSLGSLSCDDINLVTHRDPSLLEELCGSKVLFGASAVGETCFSVWDCENAAYCDPTNGCPGTCVPKIPCGEAYCTLEEFCNSQDECEAWHVEGTECGTAGRCLRGLFCESGVCTVGLGVNEPCGVAPGCREGLVCGPAYVCVKPTYGVAEGAPCGNNLICDNGLDCPPTEHFCQPATSAKPDTSDCQ